MLDWLHLRNLALVEKAEIDFTPGFNVLTGETGAGKSVIMNAISLLLGGRADRSLIRSGTERCEISAGFSVPSKVAEHIVPILQNAGINAESNPNGILPLNVRRVITLSGVRNYLNDSPTTAQLLREIAEQLLDIHSANEHYSLSRPTVQLALLDRFGSFDSDTAACRNLCSRLDQLQTERQQLLATIPSGTEAEYLRRAIEEIESAALQPHEEQAVLDRHRVAANSCGILETAAKLSALLQDREDSIRSQFASIYRDCERLAQLDPHGTAQLTTLCSETSERLDELIRELDRYSAHIEVDERELAELEERLAVIQKLKRRYGPTFDAVADTLNQAQLKLDAFENASERLAEFSSREHALKLELTSLCQLLHLKRQKAGALLGSAVTDTLRHLGFNNAHFSVQLLPAEPGPNGADRIEFLFSANPGEPPGILRNLASSGELSRVMLALKAVLAGVDDVPVLIFDEIDVNIGGETALVVGRKLRDLATTRQILCISHLPQVAAHADRHLLVAKNSHDQRTFSRIEPLDQEGQIQEIGRMLGGGKAAIRHATELLRQVNSTTTT